MSEQLSEKEIHIGDQVRITTAFKVIDVINDAYQAYVRLVIDGKIVFLPTSWVEVAAKTDSTSRA